MDKYKPRNYAEEMLGKKGYHFSTYKGWPYTRCKKSVKMDDNSTEWVSGHFCYLKQSGLAIRGLACKTVVRLHNHSQYVGMDLPGLVVPPEDYTEEVASCMDGPSRHLGLCDDEEECVVRIEEDKVADQWMGIGTCCCKTHDCNEKVKVMFVPKRTEFLHGTELYLDDYQPSSINFNELGSVVPQFLFILRIIVVPILLIAFLVWAWPRARAFLHRRRQQKGLEDCPEIQQALIESVNERRPRNNVKAHVELGDVVLADGKMSEVVMATYTDPESAEKRAVVVKTVMDQKTFLLEEDVYTLLRSHHHDHLAHFIGSIYEPEIERFSIVLEHYEQGCLEDYLKRETFTSMEALKFIISFFDGLSFLHGDIRTPNGVTKWPVVHRDIKSRNVLVRADKTAALADFGLAIICENYQPPAGRFYRVGTHRYMAPELLCSVANNKLEDLKMTDIYASSLIIWEILNKTVIDEEDGELHAVLPYTNEIDEEVAKHEAEFESDPSNRLEKFERMPTEYYLRNIVHKNNIRPALRKKLYENLVMSKLIETLPDLWYEDPDGRITSLRAFNRLQLLQKNATEGTIPVFDHSKFVYS